MPGNSSLAGRYVAFLRCFRLDRLAKCYRDTLPGVALYAWLRPNNDNRTPGNIVR